LKSIWTDYIVSICRCKGILNKLAHYYNILVQSLYSVYM
jgi:hypothetical protein